MARLDRLLIMDDVESIFAVPTKIAHALGYVTIETALTLEEAISKMTQVEMRIFADLQMLPDHNDAAIQLYAIFTGMGGNPLNFAVNSGALTRHQDESDEIELRAMLREKCPGAMQVPKNDSLLMQQFLKREV